MTDPPSRSSIAQQESERLWRLAAMGGTMASEIIAGMLVGWGLDALFGTGRTFLIIGSITGVVVGLATFIRRAMSETRAAGRDATRIAAELPKPEDREPEPLDNPADASDQSDRS